MSNYDELMIVDSGYHLRGLFSYVNQVISNLHVADKENKFVLVDLHTTPYNDFNKGSNCWTYYFKQIPYLNKEDLYLFKKITKKVWFDNGLDMNPILNTRLIKRANELIKKYIFVKDHIINKKNEFQNNVIKTNNYASIHYRGTDHIQDCEMLDKSLYYDNINSIIDKYDKILICSDEQSFIDDLILVYGSDKIIAYPSFRSTNKTPIHFSNNGFNYKNGEDVLIESLLMSDSKFLIRTTSNVTAFSIFNNIDLKYKNIDQIYHDHYKQKNKLK